MVTLDNGVRLATSAATVVASGFFDQFWPQLAATIAGVIIGVPVALKVNDAIAEKATRRARADTRARLARALETLQVGLIANDKRLMELTNVLNDRKAPFDAALDAARWEAVGPEIVANLDDPDLKGRLASHFDRVRALNSIYRMYLDTTIGVASTIIGSETTRETLRNYLVTFTAELKADGGHLADEVEMVIGNLLSPQE